MDGDADREDIEFVAAMLLTGEQKTVEEAERLNALAEGYYARREVDREHEA